jgi:hypothetical protein
MPYATSKKRNRPWGWGSKYWSQSQPEPWKPHHDFDYKEYKRRQLANYGEVRDENFYRERRKARKAQTSE